MNYTTNRSNQINSTVQETLYSSLKTTELFFTTDSFVIMCSASIMQYHNSSTTVDWFSIIQADLRNFIMVEH